MKRRFATTCIALMGCLALAAPGHETARICLGFDGHFDLKTAEHSCCHGDGQARDADSVTIQSEDAHHHQHCGLCLDFPARPAMQNRQAFRTGNDVRLVVPLQAHLAATPATGLDPGRATGVRPPGEPSSQPSTSHASRSAVLLI